MAEQAWSLTDAERVETVERVAQNYATLSFNRGIDVTDAEAKETAVALEKKAYTVASVEARTTTGVRPHAEVLKSYARYCVEFSDRNRLFAS